MRAHTLPWLGLMAVLALGLGPALPRSASAQAVHPAGGWRLSGAVVTSVGSGTTS